MRHLRWLTGLMIFMITTSAARDLHGWAGFWIASLVLMVHAAINYFDGYYARQRELEESLNGLRSPSQIPPHRPPRAP